MDTWTLKNIIRFRKVGIVIKAFIYNYFYHFFAFGFVSKYFFISKLIVSIYKVLAIVEK